MLLLKCLNMSSVTFTSLNPTVGIFPGGKAPTMFFFLDNGMVFTLLKCRLGDGVGAASIPLLLLP